MIQNWIKSHDYNYTYESVFVCWCVCAIIYVWEMKFKMLMKISKGTKRNKIVSVKKCII